ncbi:MULTISPECIES: SGNH/GDSL hydrolase family protein [unclassified Sphingobium]|uniref:SGNH/GDSL hydrolase family protein n=1 Tax=unclassified Sphingobium TaxID=2611147 RepID=UPI001EEFBAC9|nr:MULTISPECIES: SGNH/GDSL hydrolase family protein [unclassified Sphingobium]
MNLTGGLAAGMAKLFATAAGYHTDAFFGEQNVTGAGVAVNTHDPRLTLGSGWAADTTASIVGGRFLIGNAGASGKLRFTPTGSFTKFRFWYPTASICNTALTVSVKGSVIDTFNQTGSNSLTYRDYTAAGSYIEIGGGTTGKMYAAGIETFDGTATPLLLTCGYWGAKAVDLNLTADPWSHRNELVALDPDYAIIYCTINDTVAGTAGDSYYASIEGTVAALKTAGADGCLVVGMPPNSSNATGSYLANIARILRNIALDYGWSFYDSRTAVGFSQARMIARGYQYDGSHPNVAGHSAIATGLYAFLSANGL